MYIQWEESQKRREKGHCMVSEEADTIGPRAQTRRVGFSE